LVAMTRTQIVCETSARARARIGPFHRRIRPADGVLVKARTKLSFEIGALLAQLPTVSDTVDPPGRPVCEPTRSPGGDCARKIAMARRAIFRRRRGSRYVRIPNLCVGDAGATSIV
jgi:hypothetical protein